MKNETDRLLTRAAPKRRSLSPAVLLLACMPVFGAVEGVVMNRTTSKPQPQATVTLIRLGNAMNTAGSVTTDAQGKFRIDQELQAASPHLLQVLYQGVTYNTMLPPGSASTALELPVYDSSANAPNAKVSQHMILVEPTPEHLAISETLLFTNTGNVTFNRIDGTLKIYVPANVSSPIGVTIQAPQGMPIRRPAEKSNEANTYVIKYPIKPGETRIDLSYTLPPSDKFETRVLHGGGPVRIVTPNGVTLEGSGVTELGRHEETQAMIYQASAEQFAVKISGTGSLRQSTAAAPGAEEDTSPSIEQVKPRIYKRVEFVVALSLAMLAIGFVLLYRSDLGERAQTDKRA